MKTEASEYLSLLQEIQNNNVSTFTVMPADEPRFTIETNSRNIIVPSEFSFLSVQNDHRAETIYFEIDRYFDNVDLSQHACVVQFINKSGTTINEGTYPVTSMDIDSVDGKIVFGWEIRNDATQLTGDITFSVRFYSIDNNGNFTYNFNTLTASSYILPSLNIIASGERITATELEVWTDKMNNLASSIESDIITVEEKIEELENYIASIPEDYTALTEEVGKLSEDIDDLVSYEYGVNLLDLSSVEENVAISTNGNTFVDTNQKYNTTGFISVEAGKKYGIFIDTGSGMATVSTYRIFGYDENHNITSAYPNLSYSKSEVGSFEIADTDKYIRVSMSKGTFTSYVPMLCETDGSTFPTTISEYKRTTLINGADYVRNERYSKIEKPFKGLKWGIIGDSYSDPNVLTYADYRYFNHISDLTGIEISQNVAKAGSGYKRLEDDGTNEHSFPQQANLLNADIDIVTVFGGGNDCSQSYPIGEYTDLTLSTGTVCGAINSTISKIYSRCPKAKIIVFAPSPWSAYYPYADDEGGKMKELAEALKKVCEYRGIQFVDLFHSSGLRPQNETFRAEYYYDTVHPNNKGHEWLYPFILDAMKRTLPTT